MRSLAETMIDQICFRNNMDRIAEENSSETMKEAMITINKEFEKTTKLEGRQRYEAEVKLAEMIDKLLPTE